MWQPRLGISWDPGGDGKQVVRASAGIFYARIPGLNLASTRSTDGTRGQTLFRDSSFNGFGVTPPTWPNLIPQSQIASPDHPDVFVFDKNFQNPRTYSGTHQLRARARREPVGVRHLHPLEDRARHAVHQPQRRRSSARRGRTGLGRRRPQRRRRR